jgi:hypothetical protein
MYGLKRSDMILTSLVALLRLQPKKTVTYECGNEFAEIFCSESPFFQAVAEVKDGERENPSDSLTWPSKWSSGAGWGREAQRRFQDVICVHMFITLT